MNSDPNAMLRLLGQRASDRKCRLYSVACCRRIWHLLSPESRDALAVAERYADGDVGPDEVRAAAVRVKPITPGRGANRRRLAVASASEAVRRALDGSGSSDRPVVEAVCHATPDDQHAEATERAAHLALSQDIFGPFPIRPFSFDPAWRTPVVLALARAAYEHRLLPSGELDLDRLVVLADACEEAGHTDSEFLGHLRSPVAHVRGCWPVDLLLGSA